MIVSAIKSSFDGTKSAQFAAWLRRISRRVADYHEAVKRRPKQEPLPEEHERDEEIWGEAGDVPDPTEEVVERSVVEQALGDSTRSTAGSSSSRGPRTSGSTPPCKGNSGDHE